MVKLQVLRKEGVDCRTFRVVVVMMLLREVRIFNSLLLVINLEDTSTQQRIRFYVLKPVMENLIKLYVFLFQCKLLQLL